jgi:hypothetical protein
MYIYIYIYTYKCHKETSCKAILNKFFPLKNGEQEGKTGPVWGLVSVEGVKLYGKCEGG